MPDTDKKVTDSWMAHQQFMKAVQRFLDAIRVDNGEVWIGEVSFGSSDQPGVRVPLRSDVVHLVGKAVDQAERLAADVTRTLSEALQITRDRVEKLLAEGAVNGADLARLMDR